MVRGKSFADELALFCRTFDDQQELTDELKRNAGTVGQLISTPNTKFMNVNAGEVTLKLHGEDLESVEEFAYLGSKVSRDCKIIGKLESE